ncbi:MAG: zinc-binding alcohol dehydrogenase [Chloroflexi bacterium]|nr:zinc-binding alcohol dehydrogenase [Chloroflexota bacterium]
MRRVLMFRGVGDVAVEAAEMPVLAADEVLVETAVSAISAGTEMLLYRGQMPPNLAVDETIEALDGTFSYPLPYGYACVGYVVETGMAVDPNWLGRLVFAFQPHQTHFAARPEQLLPVPQGISPETAVFLPNMETAVSFVMDGRPVIGEQVVVFGQGVVGLLTTMLLAEMPLAALVTLDGYALRRDWSRRLGAMAVFDPADENAVEAVRDSLPVTGYDGADLIYELSGNPQALAEAIEVAGFNGRILIGSWYGRKEARLPLGGRFHRAHMQLISSQVSHLHPRWRGRWNKKRRLELTWQMLARHNPARLISHRILFAQAPQAYELLDTQPNTAVQVILTYG